MKYLCKSGKTEPLGKCFEFNSRERITKRGNEFNSDKLALLISEVVPSTSQFWKLPLMISSSNWDNLDITFGGIYFSLSQPVKPGIFKLVISLNSLGNATIPHLQKLKVSSLFNFPNEERSSLKLQFFKYRVRRFVNNSSDCDDKIMSCSFKTLR